jgi:hypothetical protein
MLWKVGGIHSSSTVFLRKKYFVRKKAHDRAYFDAHILHRNINITNIVTSATGMGLLIDWELSESTPSFRPTVRASFFLHALDLTEFLLQGTWQCMSAAVLRDSQRVQSIEDDRESAVHVLTLLALCYNNNDELNDLNLSSTYLQIYDEVDPRQSESIATGGRAKGDNFSSEVFPTFLSGPLNRFLTEVRETFSSRYQRKKHSSGEIQLTKDLVTQAESNPVMDPHIYRQLAPYIYGTNLEALMKPNWLVEVFNKHLESDDWPLYDKAAAKDPTSTRGSAHKRTSTQAALHLPV